MTENTYPGLPSLEEIQAASRGEKPEDKPDLRAILAMAEKEAASKPDPLGSLLALGCSGELPAITLGAVAVLESIDSPYLLEGPTVPVITILDTARGLYACAGGPDGCAPLLTALALERAADVLPDDMAERLRAKAAKKRGDWDVAALKCLEESGLDKVGVDTEMVVRIRSIYAEMNEDEPSE